MISCSYEYSPGISCVYTGKLSKDGYCPSHQQETQSKRADIKRSLKFKKPNLPEPSKYDKTAPWCSDPKCKCGKPTKDEWLTKKLSEIN